ncbi:hypothetical protein FXO37_20235 [Capsicum annuum]|nr:hypothetical protein FXO37_20235 [Capsicum annuum]
MEKSLKGMMLTDQQVYLLQSLPGTLSILFDNFLKTKFHENFCAPVIEVIAVVLILRILPRGCFILEKLSGLYSVISLEMDSSLSAANVSMATDNIDVLERIASQLFTTSHEQQFNEEEIQVVSYPNKPFPDMKSEPLSDASVPNMDMVINAPVSGGISLMPSSLSQVDTSIFQQLPEEFLAKLKYELLCNSKIAIIQLGFCILTLTELRCRLLDTPNEQLWPGLKMDIIMCLDVAIFGIVDV